MTSNRRSMLKGMALGGTGAALPGALVSLAAPATALAQTADGGPASQAWLALAHKMAEWDAYFSGPASEGTTSNERAEARLLMADALQLALDFWTSADTANPDFTRFVTPDRKLLGDNPDAIYFFAPIRPDGEYIIRGKTAGATYTSFAIERSDSEGGQSVGLGATLNDTEFDVASDGSYEVHVGGPSRERNWLALAPDARTITTRHYFERVKSVAADQSMHVPIEIHPTKATAAPPPVDEDAMAVRLRRVINYFDSVMAVAKRTGESRAGQNPVPFVSAVPNRFTDPNAAAANRAIGYAAADNRYLQTRFELAPGEALEMRGRFPECRFANVVLFNRYIASFDYVNRQVSLNRKQTELEKDGSFRIILAAEDPGLPNWIDTEGRPSGTVFWRFLLAPGHIEPITTRVVKVKDLKRGR